MTAIKQTAAFTARNIRLFFKDKGMFISALISPLVIFLLYVLFLHSVLTDAFNSNLPEGLALSQDIIGGYIAAFEVSSILSVCCVTVAFVANMAMVSDLITGARADLNIAPVKKPVLVLGYYFATAVVTMVICYAAMCVGFIYMAAMGWYLTAGEVFAIILDVLLASLFGTALSSLVCFFLKSQGAVNAVSTIVSTVYGFVSGAYYPIAQFSSGMANTVMCLPGTYCTGLFRTHFMAGFDDVFSGAGLPADAVDGILTSLDAKMSFFGNAVPAWAMYAVVAGSVLLLVGAFVLVNVLRRKRNIKT